MAMGAQTFTDEQLIEAWAWVDGVANVARELGATYAAVNNRAMRLRLRGVPLRRMPVRPRNGCVIAAEATPEALGVDSEELRRLVNAFRLRND
jgi:hypothetical protein